MSEQSKQIRKLALDSPNKAVAELLLEFADYMESTNLKRKELDDIIEQQQAEIDALKAHVEALESKRPLWAKGFSSDSVTAQIFADALIELWGLLGVYNQTGAVEKLKRIRGGE